MGLGNFIKESIGNAFRSMADRVPDFGEQIIHRAKLEAWKLEKKFMKNLASLLILMMSFAAFALSATFFFIEYINLTKTLSLLIIGIILLIIGIILKI